MKEMLPQRRMQDLRDVNHLFRSSTQKHQKRRMGLIRHSKGNPKLTCLVCVCWGCAIQKEAGGTIKEDIIL